MSDDVIRLNLQELLEDLAERGSWPNAVKALAAAIDRLESLTRTKAVPDSSVDVRVAVAVDYLNQIGCQGVCYGLNDQEALNDARNSLSENPIAECIAVIRVPKVVIPTIQAEVVEVPNAETRQT